MMGLIYENRLCIRRDQNVIYSNVITVSSIKKLPSPFNCYFKYITSCNCPNLISNQSKQIRIST
ncbi:hypothetical protein RchiOBHm_Chr2g0173261 [Rosa chinensis]|uniref:Uncharacterized protein n=1 Tax=Rosa chinensis TaxID=74649 RepID=A0A2P6S5W9_ROSCH|nr:hypothetical protein RchiOBHm_Chr3g0463091 [Rosa chinensis]PRQ54049.1 hypothetical protein RchiOBHm_Chr2g0173261 [Rosa chinensis]